eukprot:gene23402-43906_t
MRRCRNACVARGISGIVDPTRIEVWTSYQKTALRQFVTSPVEQNVSSAKKREVSTAIALSASVVSSAMAQRTVIITNQNNVAKAIAETNAGITRTNAGLGGTVAATSAAIGNTASIDVGRVATVTNTQSNNALVSATLNLPS